MSLPQTANRLKKRILFRTANFFRIINEKEDCYLVKIAILFWRTEWDSPPAGGLPRVAACPRHAAKSPRFESHPLYAKIPAQGRRFLHMADRVGFDLRCGGGRLAALGCPRQPIHYRSGSNPNERSSKKKTATLSGDCFFLADRVGFEPTSLLRDYLISSVVPRTDFSGSWAKIAPLFGSPEEPSKPLVSRQFYPQSRIASRGIRTHRHSLQNGLQNRKKERIWGERRENRRELQPCFHSKF